MSTSNTSKVLEAIMDHWREFSIPPTIRDVERATGINSTSLIRSYYSKLEQIGAIKRVKSKPVPIRIYELVKGDLRQ